MSAKISLSNAGWSKWRKIYRIDRTRPAIIESYMSDSQWDKFCDDVDEALAPANRVQQVVVAFLIFAALIFFVPVVFSPEWVPVWVSELVRDTIGLKAFLILYFVYMICLAGAGWKSRRAGRDIRKICTETSACCERRPPPTFTVRFGYLYNFFPGGNCLTVSVDPLGTDAGPGPDVEAFQNYCESETMHIAPCTPTAPYSPYKTVTAPYVPTAPNAPSAPYEPEITAETGPENAVPQRIEALEKIKYLLTEQEYAEKRAEILAEL